MNSRSHLTAMNAGARWMIFGTESSLRLASHFWSLRALGARPSWRSERLLTETHPPPDSGRQLVIHAPEADVGVVQQAMAAWSKSVQFIHWSRQEPQRYVPSGHAYFSSHSQAVPGDHDNKLFFSTTAPPVVDGRIRPQLTGVIQILIASDDPANPDGFALTRNEASRRLLHDDGAPSKSDRVTALGIAGVQQIEGPELLSVPNIAYEDAVAAPLVEAGYAVASSDKGRYQQRSLQLAGGLRFLAACFKQKESSHLLDLFFEHHLGKAGGELYRRAVTYSDLYDRLIGLLHERRKRLSRPLKERAGEWLTTWADGLLRRGLLIGGYVLACSHCAHRAWYRLDDLDQAHECERCAASTYIPADAVRSFRLNEAFFQLRLNNGEVVTLLLAALRESADHSFLYLPEVALSHPEAKDGEADVAAVVDGHFVLAEAKSNNTISKKEAGWYQYVARRSRAKQLIFATTDRSNPLCSALDCAKCRKDLGPHHRDYAWSDGTKTRIRKIREEMAEVGIRVDTFCYENLAQPDSAANYELTDID